MVNLLRELLVKIAGEATRGSVKARDILSGFLEDADILCSVITVAEIHAGMKPHEREKTLELLESLVVSTLPPESLKRRDSTSGKASSLMIVLSPRDCS